MKKIHNYYYNEEQKLLHINLYEEDEKTYHYIIVDCVDIYKLKILLNNIEKGYYFLGKNILSGKIDLVKRNTKIREFNEWEKL